jgi:hypothetical protein
MANNWVVADLNSALAFDLGIAGSVATVAPILLELDTNLPSSTTVGTPVSGGSYAPQTMALAAVSSGQTSNSAVINFTGMPAVGSPGVQGVTVRDSAGTPVQKWRGPLTAAKITNAGDTLSFAVGAVVISVS